MTVSASEGTVLVEGRSESDVCDDVSSDGSCASGAASQCAQRPDLLEGLWETQDRCQQGRRAPAIGRSVHFSGRCGAGSAVSRRCREVACVDLHGGRIGVGGDGTAGLTSRGRLRKDCLR